MQDLPDPASELDAALIAAHAARDLRALTSLYTAAADRFETVGDHDAACFMLTQAYVFALDAGADQATDLHARLVAYGRED